MLCAGGPFRYLGDMTGIDAGNVKAKLHRARPLMQKCLEA